MLKNYFAFSLLLLISINIFSQDAISEDFIDRCNHENCYKDQIEKIISLILPEGSKIESIEKSEFPGIYKVYFGDLQPIYVSEDGRYFLYGQMFKIDLQTANVGADLYGSYKSLEPSVKNLTDLDMFEKRRSLMKEIQESELITFKAVNEKHSLTIFTDVDCGYCRKLHKQIKEYNDLGISIKYAAFPRSGLGTDTFTKMVGAWCSEDTKAVLTSLKDGKEPRLEFCESQPVAKHYAIGKKIGITGTPAIITNEGELLPGYYSPQDLLKKLKS
jgi:thiol:disulfide interchange protein DsbC